ncbi:MAG: hypothetical protein H6603_07025 [Flavobacteriales bacterium]|nr:hypothetical protein [Flavobacteriales bacterium]
MMKKVTAIVIVSLVCCSAMSALGQDMKPANDSKTTAVSATETVNEKQSEESVSQKPTEANRASTMQVEPQSTEKREVRRKENGRKGISPNSPE